MEKNVLFDNYIEVLLETLPEGIKDLCGLRDYINQKIFESAVDVYAVKCIFIDGESIDDPPAHDEDCYVADYKGHREDPADEIFKLVREDMLDYGWGGVTGKIRIYKVDLLSTTDFFDTIPVACSRYKYNKDRSLVFQVFADESIKFSEAKLIHLRTYDFNGSEMDLRGV